MLSIGACVRHAAFHKPVVDGPLGALLAQVARHIAHYPIRTRGTFCGSLAHADPASEWCLVAATLDATLVAHSTRGAREIAAKDLFRGHHGDRAGRGRAAGAKRGCRCSPPDTKFGFNEFSRRAGDFAMARRWSPIGCKTARSPTRMSGVGGAEPFPRRIAEAEAALNGETPGDKVFRAAAEAAAEAIEPMEDHQTTADYRRDLVRAVVRRALERPL